MRQARRIVNPVNRLQLMSELGGQSGRALPFLRRSETSQKPSFANSHTEPLNRRLDAFGCGRLWHRTQTCDSSFETEHDPTKLS